MLSADAVHAAEEGRFHVWAAGSVDEGMELLSGMPAGERQVDGGYPANTVHRLVRDRLRGYAERLNSLAQPDGRPPASVSPATP